MEQLYHSQEGDRINVCEHISQARIPQYFISKKNNDFKLFFLFVQKERPTNSLVKKEERVDPKIEKEPEDKRSNSDLESRVQELYG